MTEHLDALLDKLGEEVLTSIATSGCIIKQNIMAAMRPHLAEFAHDRDAAEIAANPLFAVMPETEEIRRIKAAVVRRREVANPIPYTDETEEASRKMLTEGRYIRKDAPESVKWRAQPRRMLEKKAAEREAYWETPPSWLWGAATVEMLPFTDGDHKLGETMILLDKARGDILAACFGVDPAK